jgi:hypothetical protein
MSALGNWDAWGCLYRAKVRPLVYAEFVPIKRAVVATTTPHIVVGLRRKLHSAFTRNLYPRPLTSHPFLLASPALAV